VFFRKKKVRPPSKEGLHKELNTKISLCKKSLAEKLSEFLVTRQKESGKLGEGKDWSLFKSGETLFKLEGNGYTLLFSTGSFLTKRKGKLLGMLEINEIDLCRLIANPKSKKKENIKKSRSNNLSYQTKLYYKEFLGLLDKNDAPFQTLENKIIKWPHSLAYLYIAKTPINLIAHSLIQFDDKYCRWVLNNVSVNYKRMLLDEMNFLNSKSFHPDSGFNRIKSLLEFEDAILVLEEKIEYLEKYYL